MKNFLPILLILLFLVLLGIGIFALNERLNVKGQAGSACPVPQIPEQNNCANGAKMKLVQDSSGCYVFSCQ